MRRWQAHVPRSQRSAAATAAEATAVAASTI